MSQSAAASSSSASGAVPAPIPIPTSLTATSSAPLPPETTRALTAHLIESGSIPALSALLTDSLARTGWTDRVRALALELLRSGQCDTFPELMAEVTRRAKIPKSAGPTTSAAATTKAAAAAAAANGEKDKTAPGTPNGGAIVVAREWSSGPGGLPDVRIPETTVEAGVEFLRERIRENVEIVEDESD